MFKNANNSLTPAIEANHLSNKLLTSIYYSTTQYQPSTLEKTDRIFTHHRLHHRILYLLDSSSSSYYTQHDEFGCRQMSQGFIEPS